MKRTILRVLASVGIVLGGSALADPSPFDLAGPSLRVSVSRHGVTLPIGAVPQLAAGDKIRVEAALPADQTVHYVLVAAFLRDPTNPPPDKWFAKSESWKDARHGGGPIDLTVPVTAQHIALFLAPATGGDFTTLRDAVKSRPGAFVRAAQDLEQASLDRGRYDAYLDAIRKVSASAPETLARVAPIVAGSLRIKINENCLQRQPEFQAACLLDAKQSVVLGNDASASNSLSGTATDLALSLSSTPAGGLGYYSPYIGAIREIIGIFGAMHSARYQYIPALGVPRNDVLTLALNTPPSFTNPKSVLMAALPAIRDTHPPVLQLPAADSAPCLGAAGALLPLTVDPLIYASGYAHELTLRVHLPNGQLDLRLVPDATRGGLVIGSAAAIPPGLAGAVAATIHGLWGFDPFVGPEVSLQTAGAWRWQSTGAITGDGLQLTGSPAACVAAVMVAGKAGDAQALPWKISTPDSIAVMLPAIADKPRQVTVSILGPAGTDPARITVALSAKAAPPSAQVIAHSSEPSPADQTGGITINFGSVDEIPANARLSFTLQAAGDERFAGHEIVEIATASGDALAKLTLGNGLTLVDPGIMVATLTPAPVLGMSAFGPLRARVVSNGLAGDWLNLGTLIRLPRLKHLACATGTDAPCTLTGDELYLLASVSATKDFDGAASVPEGYPGFTLKVPHPANGVLFVRLHDAPEVVNRVHLSDIPAR